MREMTVNELKSIGGGNIGEDIIMVTLAGLGGLTMGITVGGLPGAAAGLALSAGICATYAFTSTNLPNG